MALPATINANFGWSDHKNMRQGPFEVGSALYAIGVDKTNNKIRAYKSTNGGDTWTEQNSGSAPNSSSTANYKSVDCRVSGSIIYCFKPVSSTSMTIEVFNTSTDAWGTQIAGPTITLNTNVSGTAPLFGEVRSDGSFVIFYNGATQSVMGTAYRRAKIHTRSSGGSWTGPFDVIGSANSPAANTLSGNQAHEDALAALIDSSNRVYLFSWSGGQLQKRAFLASTFGTSASRSGSIFLSAAYALGHGAIGTTYSAVPVSIPAVGIKGVDLFTLADSPSFSAENNFSGSSPEADNSNPASLVEVGGKAWIFSVRDDNQNIEYKEGDGDVAGTWSGSATNWKAITCNGIAAAAITGAIGVLYLDGSTVKYDALSLGPTAPNINDSSTATETRAFNGETTKADSSTATDAAALATAIAKDDASAADETQSLLYTLPASDSSTATDGQAADASISTADSSVAAETLSAVGALSHADTADVTDDQSLIYTSSFDDAAESEDDHLIEPGLSIADVAAASETQDFDATLALADEALAADDHTTEEIAESDAVDESDSAAASDDQIFAAAAEIADTSAGDETQLHAGTAITADDAAADETHALEGTLSGTDSAAADEVSIFAVPVDQDESSTAQDGQALDAAVVGTDSSTAAETTLFDASFAFDDAAAAADDNSAAENDPETEIVVEADSASADDEADLSAQVTIGETSNAAEDHAFIVTFVFADNALGDDVQVLAGSQAVSDNAAAGEVDAYDGRMLAPDQAFADEVLSGAADLGCIDSAESVEAPALASGISESDAAEAFDTNQWAEIDPDNLTNDFATAVETSLFTVNFITVDGSVSADAFALAGRAPVADISAAADAFDLISRQYLKFPLHVSFAGSTSDIDIASRSSDIHLASGQTDIDLRRSDISGT